MTWAPDSSQPGYLGPLGPPHPVTAEDDAFDNFLHDLIAGISGMDPTMVRPRWQQEPANRPEINTDWVAFGVMRKDPDFEPWVGHVDDGVNPAYDALQEHELNEVLCTFYGPHSDANASILRRGFFQDQNRASCRAVGVGLVEIEDFRKVPEYFNTRWWQRTDLNVILRREIRLDYPVLTLVRAQGIIHTEFGSP